MTEISLEQVIPVLHGVAWQQLGTYSPLLSLKKGLSLVDHTAEEIANMIASTLL